LQKTIIAQTSRKALEALARQKNEKSPTIFQAGLDAPPRRSITLCLHKSLSRSLMKAGANSLLQMIKNFPCDTFVTFFYSPALITVQNA
jgi:hypothetical protein